jgi:hypothetical protein
VLPLTFKLRALSDAGITPADDDWLEVGRYEEPALEDADTLDDTARTGPLDGSPDRVGPFAARIGSVIRRRTADPRG